MIVLTIMGDFEKQVERKLFCAWTLKRSTWGPLPRLDDFQVQEPKESRYLTQSPVSSLRKEPRAAGLSTSLPLTMPAVYYKTDFALALWQDLFSLNSLIMSRQGFCTPKKYKTKDITGKVRKTLPSASPLGARHST